MNFFTELGVLVNKLWKEKNYDQRRFPAVAMQALSELPPAENVSFREGVFLGLADPLPAQSDLAAQFGQPPLTVYSAEEFRIEAFILAACFAFYPPARIFGCISCHVREHPEHRLAISSARKSLNRAPAGRLENQ